MDRQKFVITSHQVSTPPLPLRLPVPRLARARLAFVAAPHLRRLVLALGQAQLGGFQPSDLVSQTAGFLKLQIGRRRAHPAFQFLDVGAQVVAYEVVAFVVLEVDDYAVPAGGVGDDVGDAALDRLRGDAVFFVEGLLLFAAAVGFGDGAFHRAGHAVGIEDHAAIDVARGAPDGLDQ